MMFTLIDRMVDPQKTSTSYLFNSTRLGKHSYLAGQTSFANFGMLVPMQVIGLGTDS